jgi:hypothetical protein
MTVSPSIAIPITIRPEDARITTHLGEAVSNEPISDEQRRELTEANCRVQKLRRAAKVATFNGWSIGIFAALSLPFALYSVTALVMCLALALVAYNEFRGRKLLDRFEPRGPRALGRNQLVLMGVLIGYSVWNIYLAETGPGPYAEQIKDTPEMGSMLGSIDDLYMTVTWAVYGGLIFASVIFQGLNALYYFTRQKHLQSFLNQTPAWVVDLQRSLSTG